MRQMIIFKCAGNNKDMKNQVITLVAIFLLVSFMIVLTACNLFPAPLTNSVFDNVVRIHIRANSNSEIDQAVKLKVRDEITKYLSDILIECKDKKQALSLISQSQSKLAEIADNTLYNNNFKYSSAVSVEKSYFPEKEYDGYVFPEGEYDALIISLGTGAGDNWWCVAFPPLCFVSDGGEGEIVYKSWVKEILDKIFGEEQSN